MLKIDISFDDGLVGDLRAAKLLTQYGFTGTFYIPNNCQLSPREVKEIVNMGHEVGGHTVSHPMDMKLLDDKQLAFEIGNNMAWLEHLSGKPVTKFCYPRGRHDQRVRDAVKSYGYKEARTTQVMKGVNESGDPYQTPTTIHMYPRDEYNEKNWFHMAEDCLRVSIWRRDTTTDPCFFSLWGHTNELDRFGYWQSFEEILDVMQQLGLSTVGAKGAGVIQSSQ